GVFGFLGPNGAGKSTTLQMNCGLVHPTAGQVRVEGYHVVRERAKAMGQIGAVLEGTRHGYGQLSAWQNVLHFARLKGWSGAALKACAERLLRELQLCQRRNEAVGIFSRDLQQNVALICALIADPPIVVLDEPTLGLDGRAAEMTKAWVAKIARDY